MRRQPLVMGNLHSIVWLAGWLVKIVSSIMPPLADLANQIDSARQEAFARKKTNLLVSKRMKSTNKWRPN